jgi:uncharacterized protein YutE (UPF0331/DUF86 family)
MNIDVAIVQERLRLMRALLVDLDQIGEVTAERLNDERIVRHAIERIITQLVDLAVSINSHIAATMQGQAPATYRASFGAIADIGVISSELAAELAPSAGLRNILTHEYVTVDLAILARAVPAAAGLYKRYVTDVARYLASQVS